MTNLESVSKGYRNLKYCTKCEFFLSSLIQTTKSLILALSLVTKYLWISPRSTPLALSIQSILIWTHIFSFLNPFFCLFSICRLLVHYLGPSLTPSPCPLHFISYLFYSLSLVQPSLHCHHYQHFLSGFLFSWTCAKTYCSPSSKHSLLTCIGLACLWASLPHPPSVDFHQLSNKIQTPWFGFQSSPPSAFCLSLMLYLPHLLPLCSSQREVMPCFWKPDGPSQLFWFPLLHPTQILPIL